MMSKGVIYILTNPAFPEYVKIGYADNLEKRLKSLNNSSVPMCFRAYAVYEVSERLTDKRVHDLIDMLNHDLRVIDKFDGREYKREFYVMSADDAYNLFECIAKISGTTSRLKRMKPNGKEALEEQEAKEIDNEAHRGPLKLMTDCKIPKGEYINFIQDPNIKAVVRDDRLVEYDGVAMSITALANKIYADSGKIRPNSAATTMFSYKGEKLTNLRIRLEKNNEQNR